jgi:hypothetical protein
MQHNAAPPSTQLPNSTAAKIARTRFVVVLDRLSDAQLEFLARFNEAGGHSASAEGVDRALAAANAVCAAAENERAAR